MIIPSEGKKSPFFTFLTNMHPQQRANAITISTTQIKKLAGNQPDNEYISLHHYSHA